MADSLVSAKKRFLVVFAALLCAGLVLAWRLSCPQAVPAYKNGSLIRLHVVANSDSPVDQAIKYQVRDAIVGAMAAKFGRVENAEQARQVTQENLAYLQQLAVQEVRAAGKSYPVKVEMGRFAFPAKTYHHYPCDFTLPAGNYEAVRVILGQGAGANWWCVLFPPLCFVDPGSVVPAGKTAGASAEETAGVFGLEKRVGESEGKGTAGKSGDEREKQDERDRQEQIQLAGNQPGAGVSASGDVSSPAVPAFKLTAPEAVAALNSLQRSENAWTMTAGGERVEFRFKVLDFIRQSGSWFKHLLGEEKMGSRA